MHSASDRQATVIPIINPTVARLFPAFVSGLTIRSVEELLRFGGSFHLAQAIAIGIVLFLYLRYRRYGLPMVVLAGLLILQTALFETAARSAWRYDVHTQIGATSPVVLAAFGIALGAVVVVTGWMSGSSTRSAIRARV